MTLEPKRQEPEEQPNPWREYERRKAELPRDLSPFDYLEACSRIAAELGI